MKRGSKKKSPFLFAPVAKSVNVLMNTVLKIAEKLEDDTEAALLEDVLLSSSAFLVSVTKVA